MGIKNTTKRIYATWNKSNIFDFKLGDSIAYAVLYLFLPVIITVTSLIAFPENTASAAYCYVSIMISAINAIYDNALRWLPKEKATFKNIKLLIMLIPNTIIAGYALFEILAILATQNIAWRFDGILLVYFIAVLVAFSDFFECLKQRAIGLGCINELLEV